MKQFVAAYLQKILFGSFLLGCFSGCSVFDPAEEIPSYLHIDAMTLTATGNQGSSTSDITDAWVFMDGQLLGGFELPCTIPILAEGAHNFIIRGGVKMNGLSSTRAIYPAWKGWEGVENGYKRYQDAKYRHALKQAMGEEIDDDSKLMHLKHEAWGSLAALELYLREKEKNEQAVGG